MLSLDSLELLLSVSQEINIVLLHYFINPIRLFLYLVVTRFIWKKCSLHTLQDTWLWVFPVSIEFSSIVFFNSLLISSMFSLLLDSFNFFLILFFSELLLSLELSNTSCGSLFLLPQLNYSILDLNFLGVLHLGQSDCVHHLVDWFSLPRNWGHSRVQEFMLFFDSHWVHEWRTRMLECWIHSRTRLSRCVLHLQFRLWLHIYLSQTL